MLTRSYLRKIKRVVFVQLSKHNGVREVPLSLSQVKQIGGRAGRFGEHGAASSTGIVTCLHQSDLAMLTKAFETQAPVLRNAIVPFHLSVLTRVAQLLPDTFGLQQLTSLLHTAGRLGSNYSLRQDESLWKGMDIIDRYGSDLRLVEKMQFAVSPTAWRSDLEVETFEAYLQLFMSGEPVDLRESLDESQLLATLESVTQARVEHQRRSPGGRILGSAAGYKVQNSETLATLETLHKVLINYIWLAFRMPVSFHQQPEAVQLKEETEAGIEFILEGIGNSKVRRRTKSLSLLRAVDSEPKIQYKGKEEKLPIFLRRFQASA
jgi:ATP-dependent RNA helicase SUPV3L1/SUV3